MEPRAGVVTIVGVGLIGGSIGLALRAKRLAGRVIGLGRDRSRLEQALRLGAIDALATDPREAFAGADVAVICTPVTRVVEDVATAAEFGPTSLLITDAGSTKARIVEGVEADLRARAAFVAAHPIAGSERQGVAHARGDLFDGRTCVLTPTGKTPADRLQRARMFWTGLGCRLLEVDPQAHDHALALTSHLPHAVASALAGVVPPGILAMAGGAYRDGTRVAGADGALWTGIFLENRDELLRALAVFDERLNSFRGALASGDSTRLQAWWDAARAARDRFDAPPPAGDAPLPV